jgi:hypothetical protein
MDAEKMSIEKKVEVPLTKKSKRKLGKENRKLQGERRRSGEDTLGQAEAAPGSVGSVGLDLEL